MVGEGCWYTLPPPPSLTYNHIIVPARPYKTGLNSYQMVFVASSSWKHFPPKIVPRSAFGQGLRRCCDYSFPPQRWGWGVPGPSLGRKRVGCHLAGAVIYDVRSGSCVFLLTLPNKRQTKHTCASLSPQGEAAVKKTRCGLVTRQSRTTKVCPSAKPPVVFVQRETWECILRCSFCGFLDNPVFQALSTHTHTHTG